MADAVRIEAGRPEGSRERRKAATRRDLILAGRRLFGRVGLYEARIEDLTADAGIAKGTLYTYFADKEELIRAVASDGFAELERYVAKRVGKSRDGDEVMHRVIRAHFEFFAEQPDLVRVFHQLRGMLKFDRPQWRPLRASLDDYLAALARILAHSPTTAVLSQTSRVDLARVVFGAVSGVVSVTTATHAPKRVARDRRAIEQSLGAMALSFSRAKSTGPRRSTKSPDTSAQTAPDDQP